MFRFHPMSHAPTKPIQPILEQVTQIVRRHLPASACRILLFGSWARSDALPTSDIDIGILGEEPVDELTLAQIKEEIDGLPTLRKVEVVDLHLVDDRFRNHVVQQGEILP